MVGIFPYSLYNQIRKQLTLNHGDMTRNLEDRNMKKRLPGLLVLAALFLFTACTEAPAAPPGTPPSAPPETQEPGLMTFGLTAEEQSAYEAIRADKDDSHLEGLEPVSVAKLYIQALLDEDYETEYALYDTSNVSEVAGWTLEEHLEIPEGDRPTSDEVYEVLVPLVDGEFIEVEDSAGYINYKVKFHDTGEEVDMGFQLRKVSGNVWKVSFLPIQ
jgi:hypothetical protein